MLLWDKNNVFPTLQLGRETWVSVLPPTTTEACKHALLRLCGGPVTVLPHPGAMLSETNKNAREVLGAQSGPQ